MEISPLVCHNVDIRYNQLFLIFSIIITHLIKKYSSIISPRRSTFFFTSWYHQLYAFRIVLRFTIFYQNKSTGRMKFGRRHGSDDDHSSDNDHSSDDMCSEHVTHCCKCYDISQIFSSDTRQSTSLTKQSFECVETDISTV